MHEEFGQNKEIIDHPKKLQHRNTYENTDRLRHIDESVLPEVSGIHNRGASIDDILDHISLALRGYQSFWLQVTSLDPWIIYFPYSWYLDDVTRIFNVTTNAEYEIERPEPTIGEKVVKLKGANVEPPAKGDILQFDITTGKVLKYIHAYPNADDVNRYVTEAQIEQHNQEGFNDTIAYKIQKHEPAEIEGKIQYTPRKMEEKEDPNDGDIKHVFMEHFDSDVTFQVWTRTMERTARLARWFRTFMRMYRAVFQLNGTQQMVFTRQSAEYNVTRWRNDIIGSTVYYTIRSQEVYVTSEVQMKQFSTSVGILDGQEEVIDIVGDIENLRTKEI